MPIRILQSKHNAHLKLLRRALERPVRLGDEADALIAVEGPKLVEEALRAQLPIACIFAAHELSWIVDKFRLPNSVEVLYAERELLASVLSTESPQPVAALVRPPEPVNFLHSGAPILVLAGIQDPGNLGTIARSAEAFGAAGIIALPGTVSPWNGKAIRASAGSLFRLPMVSLSLDEALPLLREAGYKLWTTAVNEEAKPIPAPQAPLAGPVALVIGNEGRGVPEEVALSCDGALTIPCPGPVESLNASVAASILLYEAARQRIAR